MKTQIKSIYENILDGDQSGAVTGVQNALEAGLAPEMILNEGMISAMSEVGQLFEEGEYFVPEMLISARAMQAGLELLRLLLLEADIETAGRVAIGTVKGDLHDIGKNLVGMMLEGAGFEVIDLGVDVSPEEFVAAINNGANIVGLSALLTTTMPSMGKTIEAIEEAGLREQVKIIVGGAPVTADYAQEIGADGFATDASQAASLAKTLVA